MIEYYFISAVAVLVCITFHEVAHGYAAYFLGDNTAKNQGRLTLNPLEHIDLMGFLALLFFRFGWAKPVPINYNNLKKPKRDGAIIALAGPLANFVLAAILFIAMQLFYRLNSEISMSVADFCAITAQISIGLGVFNLIPVPPLDGSHVIIPFLPIKWQFNILRNQQFIQFGLIMALYLNLLNFPLFWLRFHATDIIIKIIEPILNLFG